MICKNCEQKLPDESKFCSNCGCKIDENIITKTKNEKRKVIPVKNINYIVYFIIALCLLITFILFITKNNNHKDISTSTPSKEVTNKLKNESNTNTKQSDISKEKIIDIMKKANLNGSFEYDHDETKNGVDYYVIRQFGKGQNGATPTVGWFYLNKKTEEVFKYDLANNILVSIDASYNADKKNDNNSSKQESQNYTPNVDGLTFSDFKSGWYTCEYFTTARIQFTISNNKNTSRLHREDFVIRKNGENSIKPNGGDAKNCFMYNNKFSFDSENIDLLTGDSAKCSLDFHMPNNNKNDLNNYVLYFIQDGELIPLCSLKDVPMTLKMQ